ncbi:hypothetical protein JL722_5965 [Aureococcus anophagefferens]|nr:hypothetical protein JL722_5965 [Aureococcus anophagefferens]
MVSFGLAGYGLNKKKQQSSSSIYKMLPRTLASAGASARALVRGRSAPSLAAPRRRRRAPSPRRRPPPGAFLAGAPPLRLSRAADAPPPRDTPLKRPAAATTRRRRSAKADAPSPSPRPPVYARAPARPEPGPAPVKARADAFAPETPRAATRASASLQRPRASPQAREIRRGLDRAEAGRERRLRRPRAQRRRCRRGPAGSDARPPPAAPPGAPAAAAEHPLGPCDKCDGPHATSRCPHFAKDRDDHPEAQRAKGLACGADGGNAYLRRGEVIRQPGDGSCLFHSLAYGLRLQNRHGDARQLRRELMDWLSRNPDASIADTPVGDWVKWDSNCSVDDYTARMRGAGWGGGIEMAAFARRFDVDVHVYERDPGGRRDLPYKRVARFEPGDGAPSPRGRPAPVNVLYCGGVHYDALVADRGALPKTWHARDGRGDRGRDFAAAVVRAAR